MASKLSQRPAARSPEVGTTSALRTEAERLIEKERYKDAVKQAKLCYKEAGTPENHGLLERAYFLRARQLLQQGMRSSAAEVAQHLLDFGVTGSDLLEELVRLLITLGFEKAAMQIQERLGSPAQKGRITELAADQLVLHPERTGWPRRSWCETPASFARHWRSSRSKMRPVPWRRSAIWRGARR